MALDDREKKDKKENSGNSDKKEIIQSAITNEIRKISGDLSKSKEGYLILDSEERITCMDGILCQQLHSEKEQYLGKSINSLIPDFNQSLFAEFSKNPTGCQEFTHKKEIINMSGEKLEFLLKVAPIYSDGKFLGSLCLFTKESLENKEIAYLEDSVQFHELMVKYIPLGLLILNDKGNIINMNPAFERITGYKQKDLLYKSIFSIKFISDIKYRYNVDKLMLYKVDFDFETSEIKINDNSVFLRFRGFHLTTKSNKVYYLLVFGDISSRKKQEFVVKNKMNELIRLENHLQNIISLKEKELQEKEWQLLEKTRQETNRTLLAKIAHYWRQPLNNATILIQSMQDDYEFGELNSSKFNSKVDQAVFQLNELSKTLETFKYLSNDDIDKSEFMLKDVIEKAVNLLLPSCQSSSISVNTKYLQRVSATGYPRRFAQVIINIMENAIEVHLERKRKKPYIEISLNYQDNKAVIIISDNAGGIGADLATVIFDPYFTTREKESQGLGLYMAKKVVKEMFKGNINYTRTMNGSNFTITFPAKLNQ